MPFSVLPINARTWSVRANADNRDEAPRCTTSKAFGTGLLVGLASSALSSFCPAGAGSPTHDPELVHKRLQLVTKRLERSRGQSSGSTGTSAHAHDEVPSVYLMGPKPRVSSSWLTRGGSDPRHRAKMFHCAPDQFDDRLESISRRCHATYRGKVHVDEGARRAKSFVRCDALILDEDRSPRPSRTWKSASVTPRCHEATVSRSVTISSST